MPVELRLAELIPEERRHPGCGATILGGATFVAMVQTTDLRPRLCRELALYFHHDRQASKEPENRDPVDQWENEGGAPGRGNPTAPAIDMSKTTPTTSPQRMLRAQRGSR
jgi:hypothetical protein